MARSRKDRKDPNAIPSTTMKHLEWIRNGIPKKTGLNFQDAEDIMQEAVQAVIEARGRYDVEKGASEATYSNHVADNAVKMSLRARRALKITKMELTYDKPRSKDENGADPIESAINDLSVKKYNEDIRAYATKMDIKNAMECLHPTERRICELIQIGIPKSKVAGVMGISPSVMKHKILPRLATRLAILLDRKIPVQKKARTANR